MIGGGNVERRQFLGRVKSALRGASLPDVSGPDAAPAIVFDDPVARFVVEAEAVASDVVRASDAAAALDALAAVFELSGTSDFLAWDGLDEILPGWDGWVEESGLTRVDASISVDQQQRHDDNARVGGVSVGVTTADWAVASSGSLVLSHGPGRPRSASLLVEHHVAMLPANRVVSSLAEALGKTSWDENSNIAIITGPSRTGDIESILTIGVHGPRRVHIIVLD